MAFQPKPWPSSFAPMERDACVDFNVTTTYEVCLATRVHCSLEATILLGDIGRLRCGHPALFTDLGPLFGWLSGEMGQVAVDGRTLRFLCPFLSSQHGEGGTLSV